MIDNNKKLIERMQGELSRIHELVESLRIDDVENDIQNAKRCLEGHGYLELQNMVANYYYRAGENHVINELREILGLERLYLPGEKEKIDRQQKEWFAGSHKPYDCPPLQESEYELKDGEAGLIPIGEDGGMIVIGTKSKEKAVRMMRKYQMQWYDFSNDELVTSDAVEEQMIAWRDAGYDGEDDYTHMFTWNEERTHNNENAVRGFVYAG